MENVEKIITELEQERAERLKQKEQELAELSARLIELAPHFPQSERLKWAVKEGCSIVTVQRYIGGSKQYVKNVTLAKALIADMEAYKAKTEAKMVA